MSELFVEDFWADGHGKRALGEVGRIDDGDARDNGKGGGGDAAKAGSERRELG